MEPPLLNLLSFSSFLQGKNEFIFSIKKYREGKNRKCGYGLAGGEFAAFENAAMNEKWGVTEKGNPS